jgi:hypothetical protein
MNSNPLVYPKHVITIDLDTTYVKSLQATGSALCDTAKIHKWKTVLLLGTLFGSWKTYGFYRTLR